MKYTLYVDYPNNLGWWSTFGYYYYEGGDLCTLGDVSLDGIINVIDIVALVNVILSEAVIDDSILCIYDLTGDNIINVIDIVLLINDILE